MPTSRSASPLSASAGRAALLRPAGAAGPSVADPPDAVRVHDLLDRDIVYRYRLEPTPGFEYVSAAATAMTGYTPEEHYADPDLGLKVVHPDDRVLLQAAMLDGPPPGPMVLRWIRRDGSVLWTEHRTQVVLDADGRAVAVEGIARDVTDLVQAGGAIRTMQTAVRVLLEAAVEPGVMLDPLGRIQYANPALVELSGWSAVELVGREWTFVFGLPEPPPGSPEPQPAGGPPAGLSDERIRLRDGSIRTIRWTPLPILDAAGATTGSAFLGLDLTARAGRLGRSAMLTAAAELAGESIVVTDGEARITWVNAAFERATGYRSAEVLGQNPRILSSGHQSAAFYRVMWWNLGRGRPWRGELVNRRRDGSLLIEEAVISPVAGDDGVTVGYVAVKRDVTRLRQLRASLDDGHRQREALNAALAGLSARDGLEAACERLGAILCELPTSIAAGVMLFDDGEAARLVAFQSTTPLALPSGVDLSMIEGRIQDHPDQGPWVEPLEDDDVDPGVTAARDAGVHAVLVMPLRHDGLTLGALLVGGADPSGGDLRPLIPAVQQVATVARTVLAPLVADRCAGRVVRERLWTMIEARAFRSLFQPVVDLVTGRVVGFEALTRFDDPTPTQEVFLEAARWGLAEALELAAMQAAVSASTVLPGGAALFLNVSPRVLADQADAIGEIVAGERPVVLEVTEHAHVDDYEGLLAAVARLRPRVRLAVDDAGAGAANLHHLVRLTPDFVKLDISLVRGIDEDLTRQALVVGLREFARVSGRSLIAEGIETDLERTTLTELSVRFGQGYLLGAPAPADAWRHVEIAIPPAFESAEAVPPRRQSTAA